MAARTRMTRSKLISLLRSDNETKLCVVVERVK